MIDTITITKKENKEEYNNISHCMQARDKYPAMGYPTGSMLIFKHRMITQDGKHAHITFTSLPDGLYDVEKAKNTFKLLSRFDVKKYPLYLLFPFLNLSSYQYNTLLDQKDFIQLVKYVKPLADVNHNGVMLTFNHNLHAFLENPDIGTVKTEINTENIHDKDLTTCLNIKYLEQGIKTMQGKITAYIPKNIKEKPVLIRDKTKACIIAPIRI